MARLALGVAGAVIGSFFGQPALGFAIGSVLGAVLFPEKNNTTIEGARLGDNRVSVSTYGAGIPRVVGTMKVRGNVLWAKPIEQVRVEETVKQGKGSSSSITTVSWLAYGNIAFGLCAGPGKMIRRVWANNKHL